MGITPTSRLAAEGTIGRRLAVFMVLGFLALIAAAAGAALVTTRNTAHTRWVIHTYQVENAIAELRWIVEQGETTRRGALLAPDQSVFADAYRTSAGTLPTKLRTLMRLAGDNPRQRRLSTELQRRIDAVVRTRDTSIAQLAAGDHRAAIATFRAEIAAKDMRAIRSTLDAMSREERRLLAIRDRELRDSVRLFYVVLAVAASLLIGVAAVSLATVVAYTRALTRSRNALRTLNAGLEDRVTERTADLSRANEEIQRFAYIVSHDLRSPLVNVMGFTAELEAATTELAGLIDRVEEEAPALVSEEARLAAREDLPEAIGFIRTSTQKMDRLINAILQLSRQGRRQLAPEPINMTALVTAIGETIAHRLSDADAELVIEGTLPVIVSDRFSIDQIFSNLIDNAVKYLRSGTPGRITVRGRREGARVLFEIADNGRGIDPRDHARVFDLFRRSGAQDVAGEGIGLATVRALVFRLGGLIDVVSTLGEGATFRLSLPLTLDHQEKAE